MYVDLRPTGNRTTKEALVHPFHNIMSPRGEVGLDLVGGPAERYDVIYADPPWLYSNYSEKGEDRNAKAWYDCMTAEDIWALPVSDIAAENAMLGIWGTSPMLVELLETVRRWGFRYVTIGHVWIKLNKSVGLRTVVDLLKDVFMSTGYWTRSNAEILVLASRGSPKRGSKSIRQVVFAPRGRHSEKPLVFRENLEKLIVLENPNRPIRRVELFCRRKPTEEWHVWGNQVGALEQEGAIVKRRPEAPMPADCPLFPDLVEPDVHVETID